MKRIILVTGCAWVIIFANGCMAQQRATITSCPDDSIRHWLTRYHVPGAAIGILEDGRIKSIGYYGEIRPGVPVSENTLWNVASLTKPVTSATVMNAINAGKLGLDEPVYPYYTNPDIKDDPRARLLTPRIFLSHQTGFKNWTYIEPDHKLHFHFDPGKGYGYSGMGYEYLRHAVESKLDMNLEQLAEIYVFAPAGMKHTHFGWNDRLDSAQFAWGYSAAGKRYDYVYKEINAADWLVTSMTDYCRLGLFVMKGEGISKKLFHEVTRIQVNMDTDLAHRNDGMGLGWEVIRSLPSNEYALTHDGSDNGVATLVLLLPNSKRGIVIFTNGDDGAKFISAVLKASKINLAPELAKSMDEFQ
ncbi:MAG: beta-lactamase family protein [Bacteroidetes bacterium]|nr:beta-lactamase family protein [Bacteroidota bacterium]